MSEDWMSGWRNGRHVGRTSCHEFGHQAEGSDNALKRLKVARGQHADWIIHQRRERCVEGLDEGRINQ